eukprot:GDKI01046282.1.p2 GENE.GDKI01046282.1~~GDKI01046282.1.p2  ORF type:complete len:131 (-),score=23.18 GDKI01046282.1:110-502(-)
MRKVLLALAMCALATLSNAQTDEFDGEDIAARDAWPQDFDVDTDPDLILKAPAPPAIIDPALRKGQPALDHRKELEAKGAKVAIIKSPLQEDQTPKEKRADKSVGSNTNPTTSKDYDTEAVNFLESTKSR